MKEITTEKFEEIYQYPEGSGLFNNKNFKLFVTSEGRTFWYPSHDSHFEDQLETKSKIDADLETIQLYKPNIRRSIDVGASIGKSTIQLGTISDVVESFELCPYQHQCLQANVENAVQQKFENLDFYKDTKSTKARFNHYHIAITNSNEYQIETVSFFKEHYNSRIKLPNDDDWITDYVEYTLVKQQKLDYYAFDNVDFIKYNLNGYEFKALSGSLQTISNNTPLIWIEKNNDLLSKFGDNATMIDNFLDNLGYKKITENLFSIR
jgi:FkbM family methyltransferase